MQPNGAADPGVVYDSDVKDWLAFLCGSTAGVNPAVCSALQAAGYSFDISDMNVPSIAISKLAGTRPVTRRVTNVDNKKATYTASSSINGINVVVSPSSLTLDPGETKSFTVKLTTGSAPLNRYTAGSLTWTDGKNHSVRIPVVARPAALGNPAEVSSNGTPTSWQVTPGYNGTLDGNGAGARSGRDPTRTRSRRISSCSSRRSCPPARRSGRGSTRTRSHPPERDLDLVVYRCAPGCVQVGISADGDSNEEVTLVNTAATATYLVLLDGFDTNGPSATGTLFRWTLGTVNAGNTTLSGVGPAVTGVPQTHTATFTGLAPATRYLGAVAYSDGTNSIGRTLLAVRTP